MVRYRALVRVFVVSAVLVTVCALSTKVFSFPINFDLLGAEGSVIDGSPNGTVSKDGLSATLTANIGYLNQTTSGFGVNAPGSGDDTDAIDGVLGIESVTIMFDQIVTFDQLVLSSFSNTEEAALDISGVSIILSGTNPARDIYDFSLDNIIPIGQSVILAFNNSGNGFSFDEFTVTPADNSNPSVTPEPATIVLLGIGLVGLGAEYFRRRFNG